MKTECRKFIDRDQFIFKLANEAMDEAIMERDKSEGLGIAVTAPNAICIALNDVRTVEQFVDVDDSDE